MRPPAIQAMKWSRSTFLPSTDIGPTATRPTDSQALDGRTVAVPSGKSPLTYGANPSLQIAAVVLFSATAIAAADYSRYLLHRLGGIRIARRK